MAANTLPIWSKQADIQWGSAVIKTANTAKDGTGTVITVFTAGVEGSYVSSARCKQAGTNIATVLRFFINNGSDPTVAANNIFFAEVSLPATTNSETAALQDVEYPLNVALPAGYKINITVGTTVANGWYVSVIAGDY